MCALILDSVWEHFLMAAGERGMLEIRQLGAACGHCYRGASRKVCVCTSCLSISNSLSPWRNWHFSHFLHLSCYGSSRCEWEVGLVGLWEAPGADRCAPAAVRAHYASAGVLWPSGASVVILHRECPPLPLVSLVLRDVWQHCESQVKISQIGPDTSANVRGAVSILTLLQNLASCLHRQPFKMRHHAAF